MAVTYFDVAVALGRPISDSNEQAQIDWWISSAELQIKSRLGDLALLDQAVLKFVIVEAVAAKAQNPEGAESEKIDDYSYKLPAESRRVTILDEWWHMLAPTGRSGAFTIRPTYEGVATPYPDWWHDQ